MRLVLRHNRCGSHQAYPEVARSGGDLVGDGSTAHRELFQQFRGAVLPTGSIDLGLDSAGGGGVARLGEYLSDGSLELAGSDVSCVLGCS
jgi:hypothetical protein